MGLNLSRKKTRIKRKIRIRKKISGTQARPRLNVFRSSKHIYAQMIDDINGQTLVSASTVEKEFKAYSSSVDENETDKAKGKILEAVLVGKLIAERALEKGITKIVFDRNGFIYHGRVKALSDGARKAGLDF